MSSTRLTEQQIACFDDLRLLVFPGLLADRIDRIIEEFEAVWAALRRRARGRPHDGTQRSAIVPFPDQSDYLSSLLDDPRIHDIAASLLGDDFNYTSGDGNFYVGDTPLALRRLRRPAPAEHQDRLLSRPGDEGRPAACGSSPAAIASASRGASQLQREVRQSQEVWGIPGDRCRPCRWRVVPGDVVVFNHNLKHASFGGSAGGACSR